MWNRKSTLRIIFAICAIFSVPKSEATKKNKDMSLGENLEAIIKKFGLASGSLGIMVSNEGQQIFEKSSHQKLIPASITKLVTAGAFLHTFPPGSKFKTQLLSSSKIKDGALKGDLFLRGDGDPSFVSENMWYLVNVFVRTGVKEVQGNIIVDDSKFDQMRFDSSRQKERVDRAFDAPVGAMSFNWNSVNIFVRPGPHEGDPAQVWADPENEYVRIQNKVKTVKSGSNQLSADRVEEKNGFGDLVRVSGHIDLESKEIVIYKNITQPELWSGSNLKSFLQQRGIRVTGDIKSGIATNNTTVLAEYESKPIQDIVADMNKFSNNYIAEMLTKNIASQEKKPGDLETGVKSLRKYLETLKIPQEEYEIYNPSGFTRHNRMSAFALWNVLEDLRVNFRLQPELMSSLPIAGVDGTLKNRMRASDAEGWVRAKTGYLNGVVSLAGYAGNVRGDIHSFVFIYNGGVDEAKVRLAFDAMATVLVGATK